MEAVVAIAVEATNCVVACSLGMAGNVENTLVPVGAGESVAVPASSALAFKASICICAVRIYVTSAIVDETLVDVDALAVESGSDVVVADVARAVVRPPEVGTEGIAIASVKSEVGALVDIEAGVVADPVAVKTIIASAREASHGVVASCFNQQDDPQRDAAAVASSQPGCASSACATDGPDGRTVSTQQQLPGARHAGTIIAIHSSTRAAVRARVRVVLSSSLSRGARSCSCASHFSHSHPGTAYFQAPVFHRLLSSRSPWSGPVRSMQ